ncbi:MAG: tetratricopeptide repeat protein, partial [Acidiferrobacterales bacterium]|nr:tetratricopeptide repeat protein [Acidiferrobacterales bacterium]
TLANLGALFRYMGRGREAVELLERAIRLDPFHPATYLEYLGHAYYLVGRHEDCLAAAERGLALNPSFIALYVVKTRCYEGLDNEEKAKEAGKRILELNPSFTISAYSAYTPYSVPEDQADAVRALKLAGIPN